METFELRYFLGVAKEENIQRASESLAISAGSLSKAIARLEEELGAKLFYRKGRNIRLTPKGALLQERASQILQLEESARIELSGGGTTVEAQFVGPEVLLAHFSSSTTKAILKKFPGSEVFQSAMSEERAIREVAQGNAHLGIITSEVPSGFGSILIGEASFITCIGKKHPLYTSGKQKKAIPIQRVLEHSFVVPSKNIFGKVGQGLDGWRDDKFPRRISHRVSALSLVATHVLAGEAIAYVPDYFAKQIEVFKLNITGCPYYCRQKVRMIYKKPILLNWMRQALGV